MGWRVVRTMREGLTGEVPDPATGEVPEVEADASAPPVPTSLEQVYADQYRPLVRLAALLLDEVGACEEVVQEAFVRLHGRWHRLRDPGKAPAYLRQTVVNLSRSRLRRRLVAARLTPPAAPDAGDVEQEALARFERDDLVQALRRLQRRQREVLVLRYYTGLSEREIAATLGVSAGSVKGYASRGLDALRAAMRGDSPEEQS